MILSKVSRSPWSLSAQVSNKVQTTWWQLPPTHRWEEGRRRRRRRKQTKSFLTLLWAWLKSCLPGRVSWSNLLTNKTVSFPSVDRLTSLCLSDLIIMLRRAARAVILSLCSHWPPLLFRFISSSVHLFLCMHLSLPLLSSLLIFHH